MRYHKYNKDIKTDKNYQLLTLTFLSVFILTFILKPPKKRIPPDKPKGSSRFLLSSFFTPSSLPLLTFVRSAVTVRCLSVVLVLDLFILKLFYLYLILFLCDSESWGNAVCTIGIAAIPITIEVNPEKANVVAEPAERNHQ